jgi:hypothetical protein
MPSAIQTRQKTDLLFESSDPLDTLGFFSSQVREVSGYAKISILAVADQPFAINVEEAVVVKVDGTGQFVQTDATITASLVGGQYRIVTTINPFGQFMKMVLGNLGAPMGFLSFMAKGIPLP